jgi:hypothetical protein
MPDLRSVHCCVRSLALVILYVLARISLAVREEWLNARDGCCLCVECCLLFCSHSSNDQFWLVGERDARARERKATIPELVY